MSEKVIRCREKLSAAIRRALENAQGLTNQDRLCSDPTNQHYSRPRGPSSTENTKKVTWTLQTKKGEKMFSKKEKVTPPSPVQRSPTRSELRSEELPAHLNPANTARDLNNLIDNTSPLLIQQLSRSLALDNDMNMDRDLIFGPVSFLSLLLDNEEPATLDLTDPRTMMKDGAGHMMEGVLSPEDEPKSYCIL